MDAIRNAQLHSCSGSSEFNGDPPDIDQRDELSRAGHWAHSPGLCWLHGYSVKAGFLLRSKIISG